MRKTLKTSTDKLITFLANVDNGEVVKHVGSRKDGTVVRPSHPIYVTTKAVYMQFQDKSLPNPKFRDDEGKLIHVYVTSLDAVVPEK